MTRGETAYEKYMRILNSFKGDMARTTFKSRIIGELCQQHPNEVRKAIDVAEASVSEEWGEGKLVKQ